MQLAFILGSNPELSAQEITAIATILPFPWTASMIRPGIFGLKSETELEWEWEGITGFLSPQQQHLREALTKLQERLGGTREIRWLIAPAGKDGFLPSVTRIIECARLSGAKWTVGGLTQKQGIELKRHLRSNGGNLRFLEVSNDATIWHHRLDLLRFDMAHPALNVSQILGSIAVTLCVQNIDEYSRRDFGIPVPDAASGMLPPKLAQAMINLAVGGNNNDVIVYDPFCGNGRILLEGKTIGLSVYGSDIVEEKVRATVQNLAWLTNEDQTYQPELRAWQADATDTNSIDLLQSHISQQKDKRLYIVAEPFLGNALRKPLTKTQADEWLKALSTLYVDFFTNWAKQPFEMMLIIFPTAKTESGEVSLLEHLFDRVSQLGYTPKRRARYARSDALISRDLVSLTRN